MQFCVCFSDYGYQTTFSIIPPVQPEPTVCFALPKAVEPPSIPLPVQPVPVPVPVSVPTKLSEQPPVSIDNIFADQKTSKDLDVTSIITKRLNAMRKLQDNPLDSEAIKLMYNTQKDVRNRKQLKSFNE